MSRSFEEFVAARLPFPGLAAWSARFPDGTLAHQCFGDWLSSSQVEQAVTRLAAAAASLDQQQMQPASLCWTFEHVRLYLALRDDGVGLALFVENRPDLPAETVERALEEFRNG